MPRPPRVPAQRHPSAPGIARHARPHAKPQSGLRNSPPSPCEPWQQGLRLDEVRCANAASQVWRKLPATPEAPSHLVHANAPVRIAACTRPGEPHGKHIFWVVAPQRLHRSAKGNDSPRMPSRDQSKSTVQTANKSQRDANSRHRHLSRSNSSCLLVKRRHIGAVRRQYYPTRQKVRST